MLLAIKRYTHKTHVLKSTLFRYVPEDELVTTAALLADEKLDREHLFWNEIDRQVRSITLNLRSLFLALTLTITNHEPLAQAVEYVNTALLQKKII